MLYLDLYSKLIKLTRAFLAILQYQFYENIGALLNCFLLCLPQPVCIVAHNGLSLNSELTITVISLFCDILLVESMSIHSNMFGFEF